MNPHIQVQITRGGIVESHHSLSAVIIDSSGDLKKTWGDVHTAVYPRSAIKALQALHFIELGGAESFGLSDREIALMCASHNGEDIHSKTAKSILQKLDCVESDFECGVHWPMRSEQGYELARAGLTPNQCHNNCSGKHAGMIALAKLLNAPFKNYIDIKHPVQKSIGQTIGEMCEVDIENLKWSPDGCSAPTWAMPLTQLALGFAKFADPQKLETSRKQACKKILNAVVQHPFMVAGTDRYCTDMMTILGDRVFLKVGAEGVYVAAIPDLKIAIALKCGDGAVRAAESAMTALLDSVGATDHVATKEMVPYRKTSVKNWNLLRTGEVVCSLP